MKLTNILTKFRFSEILCKIGVSATVGGFSLTLAAFGITGIHMILQEEVPAIVRKALILGFGSTVGAVMFTAGAAMEDDWQLSQEIAAMEKRRVSIKYCPCDRCKYFNYNSVLCCAVNPSIAFTEDAKNA